MTGEHIRGQTQKQQIQEWLMAKGIDYTEDAPRNEIFQVICVCSPKPEYAIDEKAGHEVVQLPPYHFNPIELAWSQVKQYIKENNQQFRLAAVKELTYGGFDKVGPAQWKKLIEHVAGRKY